LPFTSLATSGRRRLWGASPTTGAASKLRSWSFPPPSGLRRSSGSLWFSECEVDLPPRP